MTAAELVAKGYGGYSGWGDTEANADFNATGGSGKLTGGGTSGGGTGGIDLSQIPSVTGYIEKQFPAEDTALQALIGRMQGQEKPLDTYTRLAKEQGLPELIGTAKTLTQQVSSIEDYLTALEPNIAARSRESIMTEAQRQRLVASEKEPYQERLTRLSTNLGRIGNAITAARGDIGTQVGLAVQGNEQELAPLKMVYQAKVDRNVRLLTGFTADRQTLLDSLYDKLNRQRTLDDREWQLANEIGKEERSYIQTLQGAAANLGITLSGNETNEKVLGLIGDIQAINENLKRANTQSEIANRNNTNTGGGIIPTPTTWIPTTPKPTAKPDISAILDPYGIFSLGAK